MKWKDHQRKWRNRGLLTGLVIAILVLLFFQCRPAEAAETWPGMPLRTNVVNLCWEDAAPEEDIDYFRLYITHSFPPEMPLTNAHSITALLREEWTGECGTNIMHWTPAPDATNNWTLLMTIPNKDTNGIPLNVTHIQLTNTWSGSNLPAFFVITAKNLLGESPFSNVAWMPAPIRSTKSFTLLSVE